MQNGYHTAKVEWIKDKIIPQEELGMLSSLLWPYCICVLRMHLIHTEQLHVQFK